ncbi:MAG: hypothetical protein K2X60_09720 [Xanthobacteraceae bacterium]|nr:hypothetical protein [Xanthobacteraceae bacterium]
MLRTLTIAALLASVTTATMAQNAVETPAIQRSGTPEEQKACAKDVSRYCQTVMNDSDLAILACLKQFRPKISKACDSVLVSHGQ